MAKQWLQRVFGQFGEIEMDNEHLPLIAILRGITLPEVEPIANVLFESGIRYIEIPLNSPDPFPSIEALVELYGDRALCGAGTVTTLDEVDRLVECGGKLSVSPHTDARLIKAGLDKNLVVFPGVATITEAMTAIGAGATCLKLFPAGDLGVGYLKSINAVIPAHIPIFAVGNIGLEDLPSFWRAGARGFGIGGGVYQPGLPVVEVRELACEYVAAVKELVEEERNG
jgi:2-dehydro-3-deoxyphosphogalactonate aldolase